jgi:hypothetical protein
MESPLQICKLPYSLYLLLLLNSSTIGIQSIILNCGGCPVHWRMLSSNPASTHCRKPKISLDIKWPLGSKNSPLALQLFENHYYTMRLKILYCPYVFWKLKSKFVMTYRFLEIWYHCTFSSFLICLTHSFPFLSFLQIEQNISLLLKYIMFYFYSLLYLKSTSFSYLYGNCFSFKIHLEECQHFYDSFPGSCVLQ